MIERDEVTRLVPMILILQAATCELNQLAAQPETQRPKLLIADERRILCLRPEFRLGQFLRPTRIGIRLAKFTPPKFPHRAFRPTGQMDPIGHVPDWHFIHRSFRVETPPHFTADRTVQFAHAVGCAGRLQREDGHAKLLVFIVGIHPAKREQLLGLDIELIIKMTRRVIH